MKNKKKKIISKPTKKDEKLAQSIFIYMKLSHKLKKADIIFVMSSIDLLPAEIAANLFLNGWANQLVFTGGVGGRYYEKAAKEHKGHTEADMSAQVAIKLGINNKYILREKRSKNSGQNVTFTRKLLKDNEFYPKSMICVHMPSAARRDYATIKKHWPEIEVIMVSPNIPFNKYHVRGYQGQFTRHDLISDMLGDLQRCFVYDKLPFNFMIPQDKPLPKKIKDAYYKLVDRNYTEQLIRYGKNEEHVGEIIPI